MVTRGLRSRVRRAECLLLLLPSVLFLGIYSRSLNYDFVWTDRGEIRDGLIILPPDRIADAFQLPMLSGLQSLMPGTRIPFQYRPLQVVAVSWIDHHLGREPRNFRALNMALGAATALLVSWLAWLLLRNRGAGILAGAIFAAHPANLENYVWIAGLSQALATFFIAACLLLGVAFLGRRTSARSSVAAVASIAALLLALLSKEIGVVAPALLFACAISLAVRRRREAVGAVSGGNQEAPFPPMRRVVGLIAAQVVLVTAFFGWWRPRVVGGVLADTVPIAGRIWIQILTSVASWPDAMAWLLLPLQSTTSDVVKVVASPVDPRFLLGLVFGAISVALWIRWLRAGHEIAALGLAWIWIAFLPTSGLIPLIHFRGERYISLSLLGLGLLLPAIGMRLWPLPKLRWRRVLLTAPGLLVVLGLANRNWQRMPDWRSDLALFESDVGRDSLYREGHHNLAQVHAEAGDFEKAKDSLERLRAVGERFAGHTSSFQDEAAIDLYCRINLILGEARDSLRYFEDLRGDSPAISGYPRLSVCGALSLHAVGHRERAIEILRAVHGLEDSPLRHQAAVEIAAIYAEQGQADEALRWLDEVQAGDLRDRALFLRIADLRRAIRSERHNR